MDNDILNDPADVNETVTLSPRMLDNTKTIPVKLKRKPSCKHFGKKQTDQIRYMRIQGGY